MKRYLRSILTLQSISLVLLAPAITFSNASCKKSIQDKEAAVIEASVLSSDASEVIKRSGYAMFQM